MEKTGSQWDDIFPIILKLVLGLVKSKMIYLNWILFLSRYYILIKSLAKAELILEHVLKYEFMLNISRLLMSYLVFISNKEAPKYSKITCPPCICYINNVLMIYITNLLLIVIQIIFLVITILFNLPAWIKESTQIKST